MKSIHAAIAAIALLTSSPVFAEDDGPRLVFVMLDGQSWTEVFRGADPARAVDKAFVEEPEAMKKAFVDVPDRARALMPFLHDVVAKQGVLLGDRDHGSCVAVTNDQWFSYPGYNEVLTGRVDPKIVSNEHGPNRNITFLEWMNRHADLNGQVRTVASWQTMNDILNVVRSGLPTNAGWTPPAPRTPMEETLTVLSDRTPHRWAGVRFDVFTQAFALETLAKDKPTVLYVSYGETDDFAHDGLYDHTLIAAHRTDGFLAELWGKLQSDPNYAGRTTMIVTTDHGRSTSGGADAWKSHGKPKWAGSDQTWIAAIGPAITPGAKVEGCLGANQVAATAIKAMGLNWRDFDPAAGKPLPIFRD